MVTGLHSGIRRAGNDLLQITALIIQQLLQFLLDNAIQLQRSQTVYRVAETALALTVHLQIVDVFYDLVLARIAFHRRGLFDDDAHRLYAFNRLTEHALTAGAELIDLACRDEQGHDQDAGHGQEACHCQLQD